MNLSFALPLALHQIASVVWIGGMFFAHFALRPTLQAVLEPEPRLRVALGVFQRFFPWVWGAIALLWLSGLWVFLVVMGGKADTHVHAMMGLALIMTLVFTLIVFLPFRRLERALAAGELPTAAASFAWIRGLMGFNLLLGLATVVIAAAGPSLWFR
ncbi:hypothetical protein CKO25_18095 [Thiocapsa imhoffii]|uniref:Copper resistance protein D domain-containing protein n=1 Tax=Thiocapsa imhoffii TaxID=382777 RepID=A0A9X1BB94_9GAMM|nr:CopD family protein [Thiocapsa imhoffii]MBK1646520.1 hypothetical protein [Thiocapsa imhoffii]